MEANNFAVVLHTQIMENIGTAENPSWATAGTRVQLIQEGFTHYGEARALAAKVASGEHTVEITEGDYVLGIDVMPIGEYRQFYEDANAEPAEETVEEDTTDDVFFAQQVQETKTLAGVQDGTAVNQGTPTVHETRARLEALSKGYFDAIAEEEIEQEAAQAKPALTRGAIAQMMRVVQDTIRKNPKADIFKIIRAVIDKHYNGDQSMQQVILDQAEDEYGSVHAMQRAALQGYDPSPSKVITKVIDKR